MSTSRAAVIAESWNRTLAGIPTVLGRLAYLATLRNPNTGAYEHFGLAQRIGEPEVNRLLHASHIETFQTWLCFGLDQQKQELEAYFDALEGDRREIVANWISLGPWAAWVPPDSRDVERDLFFTDLELVLERLRVGYGADARDPEL